MPPRRTPRARILIGASICLALAAVLVVVLATPSPLPPAPPTNPLRTEGLQHVRLHIYARKGYSDPNRIGETDFPQHELPLTAINRLTQFTALGTPCRGTKWQVAASIELIYDDGTIIHLNIGTCCGFTVGNDHSCLPQQPIDDLMAHLMSIIEPFPSP